MAYRYKYKKREKEKILIVLLIILLGISIYFLITSNIVEYFIRVLPQAVIEKLPDITALPELSTFGYVQIEVDARISEDRGIITLTGNCYQVTAVTEVTQAESIINGLAGRIDFRPNTHDLMESAFDNFGIKLVMVKIVDVKNNTFIGKLILRQGNRVLSLDSRPSDGTALAVRTGSPIYMKEDLLKTYGKNIC